MSLRTPDIEPGERPVCPYCETPAYRIVGLEGIGNQVSLLRCTACEGQWEEVLPFRYRQWQRPALPLPAPASHAATGRG